MSKNNIIFLDVDGVLNCEEYYASEEHKSYLKLMTDPETSEEEKNRLHYYSPKNVRMLNRITDKTGARIVFSSSHRSGHTIESVNKMFKYVGITGECIGITPYLSFQVMGTEEYNRSVPRGCEIKAWLEMHKDKLGAKLNKASYVILDDNSDMLFWQRDKFLWIDPYCGLTYTMADRAINILRKGEDEVLFN